MVMPEPKTWPVPLGITMLWPAFLSSRSPYLPGVVALMGPAAEMPPVTAMGLVMAPMLACSTVSRRPVVSHDTAVPAANVNDTPAGADALLRRPAFVHESFVFASSL